MRIGDPPKLRRRPSTDAIPPHLIAAWRKLPAARREIALVRIDALQRYFAAGGASLKHVNELAAELGISRSRFYAMAKAWREAPSIEIVAPYAAAKGLAKPKLSKSASEIIDSAIVSALELNPDVGTLGLTRVVSIACRSAGITPPSSATVARRADLARQKSHSIGTMPIADSRFAVAPTAFGEMLVVDHTITELWVQSDAGLMRPLATFVIDAFTRLIVGVGLGRPKVTPVAVARALMSIRSTARLTLEEAPGAARLPMATQPKVIFNAGKGDDWYDLASRVSESVDCEVQHSAHIARGTFVRRLIGLQLHGLELHPRFSFRGSDELYRADAHGIASSSIYPTTRDVAQLLRAHVLQFNLARIPIVLSGLRPSTRSEAAFLGPIEDLEGELIDYLIARQAADDTDQLEV